MENSEDAECGLTPAVAESIQWAFQEAGYEVEISKLLSRQRYAKLVRIRRLAMWRLRTHHKKSFPWIAHAMHKDDHATVMHHVGEENLKRGLPKNYPLNVWQAAKDLALSLNIDLIDEQLRNGMCPEDVAYMWRVDTRPMMKAISEYRRNSADDSNNQTAEQNTRARIDAPQLEAVDA